MSTEYKDELRKLYYSEDERLKDLTVALLSLTEGISGDFFISGSTTPDINCLIDVSKKIFINHETDNDLCRLVKKLNLEIIKKSVPGNRNYDDQMEKGLILLESLNLLKDGLNTETQQLKLGLSMLAKIGLIDLVNEVSKELIALNALKKMAF